MHLKYSVTGNEVKDDEFYGLDIMDKYDDEAMAKHVYKDPVQLGMHIVLCRSLIKMFMTLHYDNNKNLFTYHLHVSTFRYLQQLRCLFSIPFFNDMTIADEAQRPVPCWGSTTVVDR